MHVWDRVTPIDEVMRALDNLACVDLDLDDEHRDRLDEASRIDMGFPYDFYELDMVQALSFGGMRDRIDL